MSVSVVDAAHSWLLLSSCIKSSCMYFTPASVRSHDLCEELCCVAARELSILALCPVWGPGVLEAWILGCIWCML